MIINSPISENIFKKEGYMRMKKRILAILLSAVMGITAIPTIFIEATEIQKEDEMNTIQVNSEGVEIVESGSCGKNAIYTLDNEGTLIVSGNGIINDYAFKKNNEIKKVVIQSGITQIGKNVFDNCKNLIDIEISETVVAIGEGTFWGCSSLNNVELPKKLTKIEGYTFNGCSSLISVDIPKDVSSIGEFAFDGCSNLTNIEIPENVKNIGRNAFNGCKSLSSVDLPKGIMEIKGGTFFNCVNLTIVYLPEGVTTIGSYAFYNCTSLKSINLSEKVNSIGEYVFENCDKLTLYCIENSYVHSYARDNDIPYTFIEEGIETVKKESKNDIQVYVLESEELWTYISGANITVEHFGSATTDVNGYARIENTLTEQPLVNSKISITKEGYREYYFYKDIYHRDAELLWDTNSLGGLRLKKLQDGDETNPYVSTLMCQTRNGFDNVMQSSITYNAEETAEAVTMQVNAIWNEKTPLSYVLYQENGNSYTSTDGKFTLNIPNAFEANKKIYIKLIATDGTTVIEETLFKIKKRVQSSVPETDGGMKLDLIDTDSTGILGEDIAFLSGQEVKLELKNVEIKASVEQGRVRILIGPSEKFLEENEFSETITNEDWEKWKKLCENQPEDLEFLSKLGNMVKGIDMALISEIAKADTKVYGYAEGVLNDSNEVVLVGGLKIQASIETGLQGQYTVGPIPIYAKASISVEGGAEGSIGYNWTKKQLDKEETKITFEVEPALKGEGGVGVMAVATVGLEGKGSLPIEANIGGDGEYKISVKAGLSLKAQLLCFEYVLELAEAEIQLLPEEEKITRSLMQSLSMRDFSLSASEHLSEESLWLGDTAIQPFSLETTETNLVERTLKTNINPDAQIQLIDTGTTKMILWTESDANREIINNSKLVYSIYNEQTDTWSTPMAVADDGTADYAPTVVTDGEKIYVAWQNISKTFTNDATLSEVAKASTIAMSVWSEETGFSKPITVSKANTMAVTPKIALNNEGNPYVAYIENTNNDLLLTSGTNNILYSVIKENNIVHNTFVENAGLVMALDTTYINGYEVSYTLDTDNDLATLEDREIITNDKSELSTKNEVMDSNAIYIKNGNKKLRFWYQNNSIHMSDEDGMETIIYQDETGTLTDDFHVVSGAEGQLAVIWTATDEESNNQIEGILYNTEDGSWTKSVQISDTDAHVYNPQGIFTEDGKLQFLYKKTGTQTDLCVLMVTPSVDLAVDGVYCDETTFAPGSVATFSVKITNNGTKKADTYTVNIDGTKSTFTQALEPSESTVVEAIYMVPADFDYRTLNITVEAENDTDITDNTCSYEVGYPEVVVNVNDSKYEFGQLVEVRVANESCIDTTAVLEVRKDSRDGELLKTIDLGTLTKGELTTATYLWNEETENYSEDAEALYFNVVSEKAEKYTNNNYDFVVTPTKESDVEESFVLGDLNGDGAVKINDMLTILHAISGSQTLSESQQLVADIDKDGKVTVRDMLRIMHYISGASSTL